MYQRILVPVDGSPTSNRGLEEAIRLACLVGAKLRIVHVIDEFSMMAGLQGYDMMAGETIKLLREGGQAIADAAVAMVRAQGVEVDQVVIDNLTSRIADQVLQQAIAWPADLVVLGTHGRRGMSRMVLGSDAEQIVRQATTPVLLVRGTADGK